MTSTAATMEFSQFNDDECKRIVSVIERDFQLRQKEYQRVQVLNKAIDQEHERVEYLSNSKEFNEQRCLRCYKPFRFFFNPRQTCSICRTFVCRACSTFNAQNKRWTCQTCLTVQEFQRFTSQWFYDQSSQKYKRCGGAKVIRELHKRDQELEEDPGYGTLPTSVSIDSKDSAGSFVIHDRSVNSELTEFSTRLALLVDNLLADLAERHEEFDSHSSSRRETLKVHQEQIAAEIHRARTAVSSPLRHTSSKSLGALEADLQQVLIQKIEEVLQADLQSFQQILSHPTTSNDFDQKLAQMIIKKCRNKEISSGLPHVIDSPPSASLVPPKPQRQSSSVSTVVDEEEQFFGRDGNLRVIRLEDWPQQSSWIHSRTVPSDNDDEEILSSWL